MGQQAGTFTGVIQHVFSVAKTNASISDVMGKLKEIEAANEGLSKRWQQMMSSPQATSYKAKHALEEWEQNALIIDLENLLGKLTSVCIAQQHVLTAMAGALNNLNVSKR